MTEIVVCSLRLNRRVRKCAEILERPFLQAKSLHGNMKAQDAIYSRNCLTELNKKANAA